MKKYDKITPEGTRDLLFGECRCRREIEKTLSEMFFLAGYDEVATPGIEFYDVFTANATYFPQELMYKMTDHAGRLLVMRPDLTAPIARLTATRLKNEPLPLRLYYNQNIYRMTQSLAGRPSEIGQMGIELIGSSSFLADCEVLMMASRAIHTVTPASVPCGIEIGHIGFFTTLIERLPLSADGREEVRRLIEAKNYASLDQLLAPIDLSEAKALRQLPRLFGSDEVLRQARELLTGGEALEILDYLEALYHSLLKLPYDLSVTVDLGLVGGIDYYTGMVFKGYVTGSGEEVLSGGRYDELLPGFGADYPATGFAISIDAVSRIRLSEEGIAPCGVSVLIHPAPGFETDAMRRVEALGRVGVRCQNSVFSSLDEATDYAARMGIPNVIHLDETGEQSFKVVQGVLS